MDKIHSDHKKLVKSILSDEHGVGYTEEQKQQLYDTYFALNQIPKSSWNSVTIVTE